MTTTAESIDIGTLIFYKSTTGGGRCACLKNSGISVKCIVNWYKMGLSPEEILVKYDHLTIQEAYAALAYYFSNQDEIETAIAEDEEAERVGALVARKHSA